MSEAAVEKTEEQAEKVAEEAEKIEAKLEDPNTPDAEKAKLESRLASLDERMDKLIEKLDKLAASPVAPAPKKVAEVVAEKSGESDKTPAQNYAPEEAKPRKARVSSRWFGERAYED